MGRLRNEAWLRRAAAAEDEAGSINIGNADEVMVEALVARIKELEDVNAQLSDKLKHCIERPDVVLPIFFAPKLAPMERLGAFVQRYANVEAERDALKKRLENTTTRS